MLISATVYAQKDSTLHQSMTVERDFSPIVKDANKIDNQPTYVETKVKKSPTTYASWKANEARSSQIGHMAAGQVIAQDDPYKLGYVEFSAGNYVNADLKAGVVYNDFQVDIDGFFKNGNLDLPYYDVSSINDDSKKISSWKDRLLNGDITLGYDHMFDNGSRIRAHIGAGGRNYNMLNYSHLFPFEEGIQTSSSELVSKKENDRIIKQKVGNFFADASYEFRDLEVQVKFIHSGLNIPDMTENSIQAKALYGLYYEDGWQLKAGLNIGMQFAEENHFTISPELEFSKFGYDKMSRFYATLTGGLKRPDLYEQMLMTPYAVPMMDYDAEQQIFDLVFGYEDNELGYLKWGIYGGAALTMDRLNTVMTSQITLDDYTSSGLNPDKFFGLTYARLTHSDEFEFKAGGYLDYEYNKFFRAKGNVHFHSNGKFGEPLLSLGVHVLSNPIQKLSLDLGFDGGFSREMDFVTIHGNNEHTYSLDMENICDLNLRGDYKWKDNLTFFLFAKNILCCEYQTWPCIPAQKINIHAGFNWRF